MNAVIPFIFFANKLSHSEFESNWTLGATKDFIQNNKDIVELVLNYAEALYVSEWMKFLLILQSESEIGSPPRHRELNEELSNAKSKADAVCIFERSRIKAILGALNHNEASLPPINSLIIGRGDWIHNEIIKGNNADRLIEYYRKRKNGTIGRFFHESGFEEDHFG